ncbi:MAG: FHA domain-containing protein [Myxococcota bacterium]
MSPPFVRLRGPDGVLHEVGPEAIVGRSSAAAVRVDDPRVSAVHAEISWRAEGFVMLARGGRLLCDGRGARAVVLASGQHVTLAPGVELVVLAVEGGSAPVVPPTAGRDRLRFVVEEARVRVFHGSEPEPAVDLLGLPARLLAAALARADRGAPWARIAEAMWPEDAAVRASAAWTEVDERRFRNRWDQALASARRALAEVRDGEVLVQRHGVVFVELGPLDTVEA